MSHSGINWVIDYLQERKTVQGQSTGALLTADDDDMTRRYFAWFDFLFALLDFSVFTWFGFNSPVLGHMLWILLVPRFMITLLRYSDTQKFIRPKNTKNLKFKRKDHN